MKPKEDNIVNGLELTNEIIFSLIILVLPVFSLEIKNIHFLKGMRWTVLSLIILLITINVIVTTYIIIAGIIKDKKEK